MGRCATALALILTIWVSGANGWTKETLLDTMVMPCPQGEMDVELWDTNEYPFDGMEKAIVKDKASKEWVILTYEQGDKGWGGYGVLHQGCLPSGVPRCLPDH